MNKLGKNAAAYAAERFIYYYIIIHTRNFFRTQYPRLINDSGFKSRASYNGARTVSRDNKDSQIFKEVFERIFFANTYIMHKFIKFFFFYHFIFLNAKTK